MITPNMLVSELQNLLRLTAFEKTIAQVRTAQAANESVARELKDNADKAQERRELIAAAIMELGGVPDRVGSILGRAGALVLGQLNQAQTLQGALLGDLTLEHQLRERARYARSLAESLDQVQLLPMLDRLELAHTATIEWLETRLHELARTGTSAIKPTPVQAALGGLRSVAGSPVRVAFNGANRIGSVLSHRASMHLDELAEGAREAGLRAELAAERAAAQLAPESRRFEINSEESGSAGSASPGEVVIDLNEIDASSTPLGGYASLSGDSLIRHINDTEDVMRIASILAYEEAHKDRKGVVVAARERLGELGGQVAAGPAQPQASPA